MTAAATAPRLDATARSMAHAPAVSPWIHAFPAMADVAFILPALFLMRLGGMSFLIADGDTGWHLRTGEWILQNGRVPTTDLFSYTKPNAKWFAWEWLWDATFGWLHGHFGLAAVLLASLFLICFVFALLFKMVSETCGNPVIAMIVTSTATVASSIHWLARPHLVSFLFTALFCLILEKARNGDSSKLWMLPLLTVLWANLHGGFFVGLILIATYAAGDLCKVLCDAPRRGGNSWNHFTRYVVTLCTCALASVVNPYGYRLHVHIYQYLTEKYHFDRISEFQSINFHHPIAPFLGVLLIAAVGAAFWHLARGRYAWSLLLLSWTWLALLAGRNIPIFAICTAIPTAVACSEALRTLAHSAGADWIARCARAMQSFANEVAALEAPWRAHVVSAAAFVLLTLLCYAPEPAAMFRAEHSAKRFPVGAVASYLAKAPDGRIFTSDTWGGYLIYSLYPHVRVFGDGRSDFYGSDFGEKWGQIMDVNWRWESLLNSFAVDTVLLPTEAALAGAMKESSHWRPVYDDGVAIVFRAASKGANPAPTDLSSSGRPRDRAIATAVRPSPHFNE